MCLSSMSSAPGERRSSADAHWYEVDSSTPCGFDVEAQGYISRVFFSFFFREYAAVAIRGSEGLR